MPEYDPDTDAHAMSTDPFGDTGAVDVATFPDALPRLNGRGDTAPADIKICRMDPFLQ